MKKRLLLWPLAALTVAIFGVRQFQMRSLRSEFCAPFLAARGVRVFEQKSDFPWKTQPRPRAVATFSGAQFSAFARVIELKPRTAMDGCAGHSNALVFEAMNGRGQAIAGFRLEKQTECGSGLSHPRYGAQWNRRFEKFRLTPASHAALFDLASRKFGWKNQ